MFILFIALGGLAVAGAGSSHAIEGPILVRREAAYYPRSLQVAGLGGEVTVCVTIESSGAIESVRAIQSSNPALARAAMLAAWTSEYRPTPRNGTPVRDSLTVSFQFDPNGDGVGVVKSDSRQSVQYTLDLEPNQICLYGHWVGGRVLVRRSENRVYVDGVRVFPRLANVDDPDIVGVPVLAQTLRVECALLERELALGGLDRGSIRERSLKMLSGFERIVSATAVTSDSVVVQLSDNTRTGFSLGNPGDAEHYWLSQPQMADPVAVYYEWLARLHNKLGQRFVLFSGGHDVYMSLQHDTARALRDHLAGRLPRCSDLDGLELPDDICGLVPPGICAMIRNPLAVERL